VIKLIAVLRRKPGMTPEEFQDYWRDNHGPLVASTKAGRHALRYEQNPRADGIPDWLGAADADGVTIQWFESVEDFVASVSEDDQALISEDMGKFLDVDGLVWILTEDERIIWDSLT
jgi:uncharacterized protein (TIGR02118 family)